MFHPDIYDMLDTLTLSEKEKLMNHLKAEIAYEKSVPLGSYLEEQWKEIKRLIERLKYEPYIDDQIEIEMIYEICEDMINSNKLKDESWEIRRRVIKSIIGGEYYDYYGVVDPMEDLFEALIFTEEERLEAADIIFDIGSDDIKKDAVKIYKESGCMEKCIDYIESHLRDKKNPYLDVISYYKDRDRSKAVEIAELGLKKCKEDQTDIIIFLIRNAIENDDEKSTARYLKSAKMRRNVDFSRVQDSLDN